MRFSRKWEGGVCGRAPSFPYTYEVGDYIIGPRPSSTQGRPDDQYVVAQGAAPDISAQSQIINPAMFGDSKWSAVLLGLAEKTPYIGQMLSMYNTGMQLSETLAQSFGRNPNWRKPVKHEDREIHTGSRGNGASLNGGSPSGRSRTSASPAAHSSAFSVTDAQSKRVTLIITRYGPGQGIRTRVTFT